MAERTNAQIDLHNDLAKVKLHLANTDHLETRIALMKLEKILVGWRARLQTKGK